MVVTRGREWKQGEKGTESVTKVLNCSSLEILGFIAQ